MRCKILIFACLLILSSCAGNVEYGKMQQDGSVQRSFQQLTYPENYSYYYNGPFTNPVAIVGLTPGYTLTSEFWHPVELTKDQMQKWWDDAVQIDWLTSAGRNREGYANNGWRILGPDGVTVGILFSKYKRVVATFPAPGQISLSVPQPRAELFDWDRD